MIGYFRRKRDDQDQGSQKEIISINRGIILAFTGYSAYRKKALDILPKHLYYFASSLKNERS